MITTPGQHSPLCRVRARSVFRFAVAGLAAFTSAVAMTAAEPATAAVAASPAGSTAKAAAAGDDDTVSLNVFTVNSTREDGYRKLSSVTTSRIGISLYEAPQAIEIISGELLHDMGFNSIRQVFDYSSSVTVNKQEVFQGGTYKLRGFELPQYINGVAMAQNTSGPGYISSDNVDRVELAKGPVGLFYGNSSPNGVANTVTKRPQFVNRTDLEVSAGSFGYEKALVDTQSVLSREHGIAFRLVASADKSKSRLDQDTSYNMVAGSVTFHPNNKIQVQAEFDSTSYKQGYAAVSTWNLMVNPLYYKQVAAPDQTMLNYIKSKYGAVDDAAALAVISTRWGANATKASLNYLQNNWTADYFGAYGKIAYPLVGETVNWASFSPYGDKFTTATPDSRLDGTNRLADVSVILTPFEHTALQYHWVHGSNDQYFDRGLLVPNAGALDANGRVVSLGFNAMQTQLRDGDSDTQQIDVNQEVTLHGIRNRFIGGMEFRRIVSFNGSATLDLTKGPTQPLPGGGTETGLASIQNFFPYVQAYPQLKPLVVSGITQLESNPTKYQDWYLSYRGSALNDKINLLLGVRNVKQMTTGITSTGQSQYTKTAGVIGQVIPGLYAFGTYNTTFQFANGYTVTNLSNGLPIAGESKPLSSETGKGIEVGVKSALFNEKLSGTLSYFRIERNGVVASDITRNVTDARNNDADPNNDVRFNLNGGLQRSSGLDTDWVWTPTENLQFLGNLTYIAEAQIISDPAVNTTNINITEANARTYDKEFHHRLSKSPSVSSNLVGKYTFHSGALNGLFVGAGVRHTGRWTVSDNLNYDIYVAAETLFDAFAGYNTKLVGVPVTIQVNLQNITNQINDVTHDDGFVAQLRLTTHF